MHIVYSTLREVQPQNYATADEHLLAERYQAYQHVCQKYSREIARIQQYFPGWQPPFKINQQR